MGPNKDCENNKMKILIFLPFVFAVITLVLLFLQLGSFPTLAYIACGLCLASFFTISKTYKPPVEGIKPLYNESHIVTIFGASIYSIVVGLGISDALANYIKSLGEKINLILAQNPSNLLSILTLDLPNTFRLIGFLATIIPFIHGAFLTFTKKWYIGIESGKVNEHVVLVFPFFINAFVYAVLFFFIALNICNLGIFVLLLWMIMIINCFWNVIHFIINHQILKGGPDIPFREWIGVNFNTFAFLSVFIFASPSLFIGTETVDGLICSGPQSMADDLWINIMIMTVLFFRSVADYIVGWKCVYNNLHDLSLSSSDSNSGRKRRNEE